MGEGLEGQSATRYVLTNVRGKGIGCTDPLDRDTPDEHTWHGRGRTAHSRETSGTVSKGV